MVVGGSSNGADGEKSRKDGEEVGGFLEKITEDGERVGEVCGRAHENYIEQAEGERDLKAAFACARGGCGGHR
jgi:DNA-binding transcriptional regulator LsrR (DeoR family)